MAQKVSLKVVREFIVGARQLGQRVEQGKCGICERVRVCVDGECPECIIKDLSEGY